MSSPVNELSQNTNASELSKLLESDKFRIVSVMSFADGKTINDGVTDATEYIQDAIDSIEALGGGLIYFPEGTYLFTTLTINSDNVTLMGAGIRTTILKKSTSTASTQGILIQADYCKICNLTIQGSTSASYLANEMGIYIQGTNDLTRITGILIDSVEIYDLGSYGVYSYYGDNIRVNNCYIHDVGYNAICFYSTNHGYANFNKIEDVTPGTSSNAYGIRFSQATTGDTKCNYGCAIGNQIKNITAWEALDTHGGDYITFSSNIIYNCKYGVVVTIDSANSYVPNYCVVSNNTIDVGSATPNCGIVYVGIEGGSDAYGGVISGNTIKGHGSTSVDEGAILCYDTNGLVIIGNTLYNSKAVGIVLFKNNSNINITGNVINGIQNGTLNASGIISSSTGNTGFIGGNTINATAEYGIYCAAASSGLEFGRNIISTSGTKLVSASNAGVGIEIYASGTVDPVSLNNGDGATYTITATGAVLGDSVMFSAPYDLQGITVTAYVQEANVVAIRVQNESGGTLDLASATWKVKVTRI